VEKNQIIFISIIKASVHSPPLSQIMMNITSEARKYKNSYKIC